MRLFLNKIDIELGKVFDLKGEKEIMNCINNNGYCTGLMKDCYGNTYHAKHEVIIAEALQLPKHLWPRDEKGNYYVVNHINENKLDNRIENLELKSYSYNNTYNERHIKIGRQLHNRTDRSKIVYQSKNGLLTNIYPSASEAARQNNICVTNIIQCCNGGFLLKGRWINKNTIKGFNYSYTKPF